MTDKIVPDVVIGGWYYPSAPCWPNLDLVSTKYNGLTQLCGEFLRFTNTTLPDGSCVEIMTEKNYGIGGYTIEHVDRLKQVCSDPYCTVSGRSDSGVSRMLADNNLKNVTIKKIVEFCKLHGLGCDMNIEGLASFTPEECTAHAKFLDELGDTLKENNVRYRVVTVAEDGNLFHGHWRNNLLRDVTCDYVVCMQYDRMYDYGRVPITPIDFLKSTTENMKKSLGDSWKEKYICGLPNYGYKAYVNNEYWIELVTMGQLKKNERLDELPNTREPNSLEVTWESRSTVRGKPKNAVYFYYSDQVSLDHKARIMMDMGINKFSLWHIFGGMDMRDDTYLNPWFSEDVLKEIKDFDNNGTPSEPEPTPSEPEPTPSEPEPTPSEPTDPEKAYDTLIIEISDPTEDDVLNILEAIRAVTDKEIVYMKKGRY